MINEPMMTIKKPDGTFAKVTLSEFKKIQADKKAVPATTVIITEPESKNEASPAPTKSHHIVHKTLGGNPVQIKTSHASDVAKPKAMARADAGSLLEEKMPVKNSGAFTSSKREGQVEEVIRKIGFGVAPDLQGRLSSLILARLKDVKSEDETREVLSRAVKSSGLGLSDIQADKIIKLCKEVSMAEGIIAKESNVVTQALKGNAGGMALMVEPPELPMVIPVKSNFFAKNSTPAMAPIKPVGDSVVSKLINESMASESVFKISAKPAVRPMVQDVSVPPDLEMGPVEEFKSLTITEFRRLSSNPEEAAKRLHQKMFNLQEESFVWYLDAVAAYHSSPLYLEYMSAVGQSLAERKSLANVLAIKDGIKLNEVMAIVEMEKTL